MEELLWIANGVIIMLIASIVMNQSFLVNSEDKIETIYWSQLIMDHFFS